MHETEWLAERFERQRPRLLAVAHRMLGSASESEMALQAVSLRLNIDGPTSDVSMRTWLTTVVGGVCLDRLKTRHSVSCAPVLPSTPTVGGHGDQEANAESPDSACLALLVVLDSLTPRQRLAFVLHDLFAVPLEEVAAIAGCTPAAAEQLAREARNWVRGGSSEGEALDPRDPVDAP